MLVANSSSKVHRLGLLNQLWQRSILAIVISFHSLLLGYAEVDTNELVSNMNVPCSVKRDSKCASDEFISRRVQQALRGSSRLSQAAHKISVDTRKKIVYLSGEVPNEELGMQAGRTAREIEGVRGVVNMLKVRP